MSFKTGKLTTGKILKAFRNRFGLTQKEVAKAIGISVSNLSALENDKRNIGAELAGRFSVIYGVRVERLLFPNGLKDLKGYKRLEKLKSKLQDAA
jgi:transcriptional regulator with XRE-family HTH domain